MDKNLHMFPWESLPCLDGLSVSRLPSLDCLRERLLLQQQRGSPGKGGRSGLCINRENGAYVLNPLGDLKATQDVFEGDLKRYGIRLFGCFVRDDADLEK